MGDEKGEKGMEVKGVFEVKEGERRLKEGNGGRV